MNKKYIKFIILGAVLLVGVFIVLFFLLNPSRKESIQNTIQNLFPFGNPQNTITGTTPDGEIITVDPETGEVITQDAPKVRQITDFPVAGYRPLTTEVSEQLTRTVMNDDGTEIQKTETVRRNIHKTRYVRTADSYLFDTVVDAGLTTEQLNNDFLPNTEETIISADLDKVVFRSFDEKTRSIKTYFGSVEKIPVIADVCPFNFPTNLAFQDKNEAVSNIQRFLNGFLGITISETGENSPGNETGIYDELTREAVRVFQRSRSLAVDGNVGTTTRQQLLAACNEIQKKKAEDLFRIENPYAYQLRGSFGNNNIIQMSQAAGSIVGYVTQQNASSSITYIRNLLTNASTQVYDSPFTEWIVQPVSQTRIFLTTKASESVAGYMYEIDTTKGTFKKTLSNINGLTTSVSPNGNYILYSNSTPDSFNLNLYTTATAKGITLAITTLPEKCTWNADSSIIYCAIPNSIPSASYPDDWYKGLITFNDSIWSINPITGATNKLIDLVDYKSDGINVVDLQVTAGDRYLFFRDHTDQTLWVADLFQ